MTRGRCWFLNKTHLGINIRMSCYCCVSKRGFRLFLSFMGDSLVSMFKGDFLLLQDLQGVIARSKISRIRNHAFVVVCLIPRSGSMMLEWRRKGLMNSLSVYTWCLGKRRTYLVKLLRLLELLATNIWPSLPGKMLSICESVFTHSMSCVSTKCFHVLELIGFKLVWGVLSVNHRALVLELPLDRSSCQFAARIAIVFMLKKLFVVQSSSFLVAKKSLSAESGMWTNLIC